MTVYLVDIMARTQSFYSTLPYHIATDRLKNARVRGVNINLNETDNNSADFILDLLQETPIGASLTMAHLKGTITRTQGQNLRVEYQTHGLAHNSIIVVPIIGVIMTVILMVLMPPELFPIASIPGIASFLFAVFWGTFSDEVRKRDQSRLKELLERMLEKQTSMAAWQ